MARISSLIIAAAISVSVCAPVWCISPNEVSKPKPAPVARPNPQALAAQLRALDLIPADSKIELLDSFVPILRIDYDCDDAKAARLIALRMSRNLFDSLKPATKVHVRFNNYNVTVRKSDVEKVSSGTPISFLLSSLETTTVTSSNQALSGRDIAHSFDQLSEDAKEAYSQNNFDVAFEKMNEAVSITSADPAMVQEAKRQLAGWYKTRAQALISTDKSAAGSLLLRALKLDDSDASSLELLKKIDAKAAEDFAWSQADRLLESERQKRLAASQKAKEMFGKPKPPNQRPSEIELPVPKPLDASNPSPIIAVTPSLPSNFASNSANGAVDEFLYGSKSLDSPKLAQAWAEANVSDPPFGSAIVTVRLDRDGSLRNGAATLSATSDNDTFDSKAVSLVKAAAPYSFFDSANPDQDYQITFESKPRSVKIAKPSTVDFGPYMGQLQKSIKSHWYPPKGKESERVEVIFKVLRNGEMRNLRIATTSNLNACDDAALAAARALERMPLPQGAPDVEIKFTFDYNVFKNGQKLPFAP